MKRVRAKSTEVVKKKLRPWYQVPFGELPQESEYCEETMCADPLHYGQLVYRPLLDKYYLWYCEALTASELQAFSTLRAAAIINSRLDVNALFEQASFYAWYRTVLALEEKVSRSKNVQHGSVLDPKHLITSGIGVKHWHVYMDLSYALKPEHFTSERKACWQFLLHLGAELERIEDFCTRQMKLKLKTELQEEK